MQKRRAVKGLPAVVRSKGVPYVHAHLRHCHDRSDRKANHGTGSEAQGPVCSVHRGPPEAGHAGARPSWPAAAARTGGGRAEDQRAERGFATLHPLSAGTRSGHRNVSGRPRFGRTRFGKVLLLIFSALWCLVRHYAAGAIVLCLNATAEGTANRYFEVTRKLVGIGATTSAI